MNTARVFIGAAGCVKASNTLARVMFQETVAVYINATLNDAGRWFLCATPLPISIGGNNESIGVVKSSIKERAINMKAHEVRAILECRKTQTRLVVKPQPTLVRGFGEHPDNFNWNGSLYDASSAGELGAFQHRVSAACPYGQPGDRLYVKETWLETDWSRQDVIPDRVWNCSINAKSALGIQYAADYPDAGKGWKPSIHMPRWASRITLEIVSVRVERLQDISGCDCICEGVDLLNDNTERYAKQIYQDLWESINGPGSWDANPWVWVVSFKVVS